MLNRHTPKVVNRPKVALRQASSTPVRSQSYLGAQYRRLRTRLGAPKAITAIARKPACFFYRLLTKGQQSIDRAAEYYEPDTANSRFVRSSNESKTWDFKFFHPVGGHRVKIGRGVSGKCVRHEDPALADGY